jgi:hypothetical protein
MSNPITSSPPLRTVKPGNASGQPNSGHGTGTGAREKELQRLEGMKIAQSTVQGIGMSTKEIRGSWLNKPNYALAVSLLFTRATNQRIMLGTEPNHVLSTSLLYNSLVHDSRFMQVPMSQSAPGDIIVQSGLNPDGYAGIVVDYGRIVSDSTKGVQNNSSLVEMQHHIPPAFLFRYIGVQKYPGYTVALLANAGFNPDEPRLPAGQPGGGQWAKAQMAPSTPILSGRTTALLPDQFGAQDVGQKVVHPPGKTSDSSGNQSKSETSDSLLAKVLQALKEGGPHPTPAQMERVGEACDAWQHYAVDHGVPQDVAGALIQDFIHTYYTGKSDPNIEGEYDFRQGEAAGAEAAVIVAGALVAISNIPGDQPFLKVKPPPGKFGTGDFGDKIHPPVGKALQAKYPDVPMTLRIQKGQTGVDVTIDNDQDVPRVGFKYAEIKPNTESGQRSFNDQVQRWKDNGKIPENATVQPITYDADGTVHLGFKLNQSSK